MTEDQIKYMVDRFLGWQLPNDFNPDAGISYTRPNYAPSVDATPSGTNLFDASQADAMVRYMADGMPSSPVGDDLKRLVIAARKVAFEDQSATAIRDLDKASEPFAALLSWEDEPTKSL